MQVMHPTPNVVTFTARIQGRLFFSVPRLPYARGRAFLPFSKWWVPPSDGTPPLGEWAKSGLVALRGGLYSWH